jgi:hypothetical protein
MRPGNFYAQNVKAVQQTLTLDGVSFTRPANATEYAVGDAVTKNAGGAIEISVDTGDEGAGGYITRLLLTTSQTSCTARFRVWFLRADFGTPAADNAALIAGYFDSGTELGKIIGYVDMEAMQPGSVGALSVNTDARLHFQCDPEDTSIYFYIAALDAFTPASGQTFNLEIGVERG